MARLLVILLITASAVLSAANKYDYSCPLDDKPKIGA